MKANPGLIQAPFVCSRCVRARRRAYTTSTLSSTLPPAPPPSGAARLTTRRLILLHGQDAPKFLQGIITNNVRPELRSGFYAAFLTAQGKVLNDVFVYPTLGTSWAKDQDLGYMVEVDKEQASMLFAHIKRHKLRAKLSLRLLDEGELDVWSAWREEEKWTPHSSAFGEGSTAGLLGLLDTRASSMGQRLLLPPKSGHSSALEGHASLESLEEAPMSAYTIRRYLRGVPEGQAEIPRDGSFPMNTNIDLMGGIEFKKGCYLGQELTIRTHHTGVVRRRILPVALFDPSGPAPNKLEYNPSSVPSTPAADTEIKIQGKRGRPGKWIAGLGNVGLAMSRLEMMTDLMVSSEPSTFSPDDHFTISAGGTEGDCELRIKAFVPDWVRGKMRAPKAQKRVE